MTSASQHQFHPPQPRTRWNDRRENQPRRAIDRDAEPPSCDFIVVAGGLALFGLFWLGAGILIGRAFA